MKKIILIVVTIFLIFIIGFSFKKDESKRIVVSEVTHSVFYSPWYVALENKYFESEGLDIEVVLTPGADKVAVSVISEDATIGFSGPEATVYIYNNSNEKLVTFASLTKRDGQFIVGDCKYKDNFSVQDLKGKKVLAGRSGGMPLLMFKYALKETNINENEVNIDTSIDFASLTGAYISGQGDFVNLFEPNALKVEKEGKGCVLSSLGNISGTVPYTAFYAKESYIKKNKDVIKKFNKALNKGLEFVHKNDAKTIANAIKNQFSDTSIEDLTTIVERYKSADSWYNSTYINKKDYNRLLDIMIYGKTIEKKVNIDDLITNEYN